MDDSGRRRFLTLIFGAAGLGSWRASVNGWRDTMSDTWDTVSGDVFGWFVIAACVAVVVWLNFDWCRAFVGFPKTPPPPPPRWATPKDLGDELFNWMREGNQLEEVALEDQVGMDFAFSARETTSKRAVTFAKPTGQDVVLVTGRLILNEKHIPIAEAMSADEIAEMTEDVGIELAKMGIAFDARELLTEGVPVTAGFIPTERLTVANVISAVARIHVALMVSSIVVNKHLRHADKLNKVSVTVETTPIPLISDTAGIPPPGEPA